jgi:glycosyltransferase involved in cell wall biosynthesis
VTAPERPFVSVIVPCRNEAGFIAACLESIRAGTYPRHRFEILVVDGLSDDGTRAIVERIAATDDRIRLLENPDRIVPSALNLAIRRARGEIVMRMDAHNEYPPDYMTSLVEWLERSGADNVGGLFLTRPANGSAKARAIAAALSHPFGVGNSRYRIGTSGPRWVDTVPFGCYRREAFDRLGGFDEELVRNQDEEFNLRLVRGGGRILLVPSVTTIYRARDSLRRLWRMHQQYGYFKPLVVRKAGGVFTVRQLIPAAFVLALLAGLLLAPLGTPGQLLLPGLLAVYAAAAAAASAPTSAREGWPCAAWLVLAFAVIHLAYGFGYLRGVVAFVLFRRSVTARLRALPISR